MATKLTGNGKEMVELSESEFKKAVYDFLMSFDKNISLGHNAVPVIRRNLTKKGIRASAKETWKTYENLTDEVVERSNQKNRENGNFRLIKKMQARLSFQNN